MGVTWRWAKRVVYQNITRFSRDFYKPILIAKFPSCEFGEKCASRRSRTDIRQTTVLPFIAPYSLLLVYSIMCEFWRSSHWVQWRHGGFGTFVTESQHCLECYRVNTRGWRSCRWPPHVSPYYVIVICLWSSDKWRRRLDAVDGLDWAATRVMWLVRTCFVRPAIFFCKSVKSREIDQENGYENRSPVFPPWAMP